MSDRSDFLLYRHGSGSFVFPNLLQLDFEIKRGPKDLPKGPEDQYPHVNQIDIKQMRPL